MIRDTFAAMGTTIEVVAETPRGIGATRDLFAQHEARFSRFSDRSELSGINSSPDEIVTVSADMGRVLRRAALLRSATSGVFDPAIGRAVMEWGYDATFHQVTTLSTAPSPTPLGDWDVEGSFLRRDPSVSLDLGGIVKGWSADQAVESGLAWLVSAGGDVRSALPDSEVEIVDASSSAAVVVKLGPGGLATSSTTKRSWSVAGSKVHHIVDPRTLTPSDSSVVAASALCQTAAEAEAAAKTMVILGSEALRWADRQEWISAGMVRWADDSIYATTGWELAA